MPTPEEIIGDDIILTDLLKKQWPDRNVSIQYSAIRLATDVLVRWDKEFEEDGVTTKKPVYVSGTYSYLEDTPEEIVSDLVARERLYGPTIYEPPTE